MASWWVWSCAPGARGAGIENGLRPMGIGSIFCGKFVPNVRDAPQAGCPN